MISTATILKIQKLLRGESLPYSALSESLCAELQAEQLLTVRVNGSHRKLFAARPEALRVYLSDRFEELRNWEGEMPTFLSRADQAAASGNSKLVAVRSCPGFMVNAYEPIPAALHGEALTIAPAEGTMLFVSDWQHFVIPEDVTVVGVENMENFRLIRRQRYLFESLGTSVLFVARYPQSADLRAWLMQIPNRYIHFGDFDMAGLHIYETEFWKYLGDRASFFVPSDIEKRLSSGSAKRYNDQIDRFSGYEPRDKRIRALFEWIRCYHRAYDQEGYITSVCPD